MKILFVTDLYPIGEENISRALFSFVQQWHNDGHYVDVIRSNFMLNTVIRGRKLIKGGIYTEHGIKIYNLNFWTPFLFNVRKKLPKNFSLKDYDVMISHMPSGALMALKLLEHEKIKYVCSVHCSDLVVLKDIKYSIYFRNKLKQAYLIADKISARSPVLQREIEQILPDIQTKTFVAYSGINSPLISLKSFSYKPLRICTAASLIKRKNIDIIIKALANLRCDFILTIIGDGGEYKKLVKLVNKLKLGKKIYFTGRISQENVLNYMKNNDIFVLLSDNETFGLVYLEAISSGNLIIAKKNDGIDGILKDGFNSFLINADSLELKNCLEKIYNLKETDIERIRKNGLETIKNMTMEKAAKDYLENMLNL